VGRGKTQRAASAKASPMVVVVCFEFFKSPSPTTIWQSCFPATEAAMLPCILLHFDVAALAGGSINCTIDGRGVIPLEAVPSEAGRAVAVRKILVNSCF